MIPALSGLFHICYSGSVCVAILVICHLVGVWRSQHFDKEGGGDGALQQFDVWPVAGLIKIGVGFYLLCTASPRRTLRWAARLKGPLAVCMEACRTIQRHKQEKCPKLNAMGAAVEAMRASGHRRAS